MEVYWTKTQVVFAHLFISSFACSLRYRDGSVLDKNTSRILLLDQQWRLQIKQAEITDTARYSCKATNVAGEAEKYFDLNVLGV